MPSREDIRQLIAKSVQLFPVPSARIEANEMGRHGKTCWQPFILTAVFSGMRSSELRGLVWQYIDLDRRIIRVRQRADFRNELGPPKSAAGYRDIPMAPLVAATLTAWKAACPSTSLNLVFPSRNGRIHTNSNIHKQCWGPLQLAASVTQLCRQPDEGESVKPRFPFHALRHAAASLFIEQGWPAKKVQVLMGHSSIQVTFDIYGKLWTDHEGDLEAMALLEKKLLDGSTTV
jgi:integrase